MLNKSISKTINRNQIVIKNIPKRFTLTDFSQKSFFNNVYVNRYLKVDIINNNKSFNSLNRLSKFNFSQSIIKYIFKIKFNFFK